jgi:Starch-binding associating with outer membrane
MKLLKINKKIKAISALSMILLVTISCNDYVANVDTDTDNPTKAPLAYLLTGIERTASDMGDFQNESGQILATYNHQQTAREEEDQYGVKADNISMNNTWESVYYSLTNIESLIKQGTETNNFVYVGIGQIQKAYLMSIAVDLWGNVPYTEATKLENGIQAPKYDTDESIYKSIFELIEAAKTNINSNSGAKRPGADDIFYGGDVKKWIKFANTFKLKLYNQTRKVGSFDQAGFNALIAENNFMTSITDDYEFKHYTAISPSNEKNRLYVESYQSTQFGSYQSPWLYEILKGYNLNIHTSNPDPRIKYYFYNQLKAGILPPDQGDATTGNPKADYWDKSTGFFSIRFGSTGPDRDRSAENSYTYPGIYLCGGRYDDSKGGSVKKNTSEDFKGKGIAPRRILTYAEFLFIQAELIQVGKLTGDASAKLKEAIDASMAKVDQVVTNSGTTQIVPKLVGLATVTTFTNKIISEFATATADKKLEIIMTQKWISTCGDPLDGYADYRRTGFPVLANPKSTTKEYQLDNGDGFPIIDSQTVLNNPYSYSWYYPQTELNSNKNAPKQKIQGTLESKIFWNKF